MVAAVMTACAVEPVQTDVVGAPLDDGKADAAGETRVRTAGTTLWVRNQIERETRADGRDVLRK